MSTLDITLDLNAATTEADTIGEMIDQYLAHLRERLTRSNGKPTRSYENTKAKLERFARVAGELEPSKLTPVLLRRFTQALHEQTDLCGKYVRSHLSEIKRATRWASEMGLVEPSIYHHVRDVKGLDPGQGRTTEKRKPVEWETIRSTLPHLPTTMAAAVLVLYHTGMRPGELLKMRLVDLDTSELPWRYTLAEHKTAKHIGERVLFIGPRAASIIESLAAGRSPGAYVFSARRDRLQQRLAVTISRQTAPNCGNHAGHNVRNPDLDDRPITVNALGQALDRACDAAGIERWTTYQLRHTAATRIARSCGLDFAQRVLGHTTSRMTENYAHDDGTAAARAMMEQG